MKIIFDSEEEKKDLFQLMEDADYCPEDLGLKEEHCNRHIDCKKCWENTIECEVKS